MPTPGVHTHWVDAFVLAICDALGLNWCWTIVGPDDDEHDPDDRTTLVVEYDRDVWAVWDGDSMDTVPGVVVAVPAGQEPNDGKLARLEELADQGTARRLERTSGWSTRTARSLPRVVGRRPRRPSRPAVPVRPAHRPLPAPASRRGGGPIDPPAPSKVEILG